MPIGDFEREVLRLIAANRHPDSFVAGGTVLNQAPDTLRYSRDVDLFHDSTGSLAAAAQADAATLTAHGFTVESKSHGDSFIRARVTRGELETKIEWVNDSPFRFFPVEPDLDLGWRLNFWDAATNKVIAAASRRVFRDYLDVIHLHKHHLHLGALVWAAAAKDPGLSPEFIVDWISRNSKYRPEDFKDVRLSQPVDLVACKRTILDAIHEANQLFEKLPVAEAGCFYLDASRRPVCPDPAAPGFAALTRHYGSVKGAWPRIAEE